MHENLFYEPYWVSEEELEHFGVKGMKWGVRRYQNADGTLTEAGKKRYAGDTKEQIERSERRKAKVVKAAKVGAKVVGALLLSSAGAIGYANLLANSTVEIGSSAITALSGNATMETTVTWLGPQILRR